MARATSLGDIWLAKKIRERTSGGDRWEIVCSAGMLASLAKMPGVAPFKSAQDALEKLRPLNEMLTWVRKTWVSTWTPAEIAELESKAAEKAVELESKLDLLANTVNPDGKQTKEWLADLVGACQLRDDLDSVRSLLERVGAGEALAQRLGQIDGGTKLFMELLLLDDDEITDDPWLRRVWVGEPYAWWGIPAGVGADDVEDMEEDTSHDLH